jgi:outer membrane protein assembly factor BamB
LACLIGALGVIGASAWSGTPVQAGPTAITDFLTQGYDVQRTGYNPNETILRPATVAGLHEVWSYALGSITNAQPLVAARVDIGGTPTDMVYVGAKQGNFYALKAATGELVWQQFTGTSETQGCGGPYGQDGTQVIERQTNRVYVPGGDGKIYAFDLSTGAAVAGWPVTVITNTLTEHIYAGLTLFKRKLYVGVASYCDQPPYEGRVTLVDTTNPTRTKEWLVTGPGAPSGGGIWAPGGVSIDPANSNVYTATGNALTQANYGFAEHMVRLTSTLNVVSSNYPGFQPGADLDWGATPVLYQAPGCPPQLAAKNKDGELFVYGRDTIADGPDQAIIMSIANGTSQGDVAYSPVTNLLYVPNGTDAADDSYLHGMNAFSIQPDCTLTLAWYTAVGSDGDVTPSPVVAGGLVWYPDGSGSQLFAMNAATGAILWDSGTTITGPMYQSATVANGRVYVGSYDMKLHVFGL